MSTWEVKESRALEEGEIDKLWERFELASTKLGTLNSTSLQTLRSSLESDESQPDYETLVTELHQELYEIAWQIPNMPARSAGDLWKKAAILIERFERDPSDAVSELVGSLCRDIVLIVFKADQEEGDTTVNG